VERMQERHPDHERAVVGDHAAHLPDGDVRVLEMLEGVLRNNDLERSVAERELLPNPLDRAHGDGRWVDVRVVVAEATELGPKPPGPAAEVERPAGARADPRQEPAVDLGHPRRR
jgi:hypothetical protein